MTLQCSSYVQTIFESEKAHKLYGEQFGISERYRDFGLFRCSQSQPEKKGTGDELTIAAGENIFKCATNLAADAELED